VAKRFQQMSGPWSSTLTTVALSQQKSGRQNRKNLNRRPGRPSSPLRRKSAPVPEPAEPPRKKSGPKDVDVDDGSGGFWESDPVTPVAHANVNAGDVTADVNVNAHPNFCQHLHSLA